LTFIKAVRQFIAIKNMEPYMEIKPGSIFKHYKNKLYKVIDTGLHTETLEEYVIYRALEDTPNYPKEQIWLRPKAMFLEETILDGKLQRRFALVSP
jgi:hypothetical protein